MISVMDWIEVEDFGPVRHAKIELKSLTVLTGQHNTGKTYLATLFYLLMKFLRDVRDAVNPALSELMGELARKAKLEAGYYDKESAREILKQHIPEIKERLKEEDLSQRLTGLITENFPVLSPKELIRYRQSRSVVEVRYRIEEEKELPLRFVIEADGGLKIEEFDKVALIETAIETVEFVNIMGGRERGGMLISGKTPPIHTLYIPAERIAALSNLHSLIQLITQSHGAKMLGITPQLPPELKYTMKPLLLESVSNLMNAFRSVEMRKIGEIREGILDGTLLLDPKTLTVLYEDRRGAKVHLSQASSGVVQLSALLLSLMSIPPDKGEGLVVIEEPEMNVHPNHQLLVAEFIANKCIYSNIANNA